VWATSKNPEMTLMTFAIKKRTNIELFIDRKHGLYYTKIGQEIEEGKLEKAGKQVQE